MNGTPAQKKKLLVNLTLLPSLSLSQHTIPALIVDAESCHCKCRSDGTLGYSRVITVAIFSLTLSFRVTFILAQDNIVHSEGSNASQYLHL